MKNTAKFYLFVIGMMASVSAKAQIYDTVVRTETTIEDENSSSGLAKSGRNKAVYAQPAKKPVKRPPKKVAVKPKGTAVKSRSHNSASSSSSSKSKKTTKTKVTYEYKPAKLSIPPQQPPVVNYYDHRSWTTNNNYFGDTSATYEGQPDTLKYDLLRDGTLVPHTEELTASIAVDTCKEKDRKWKEKVRMDTPGYRDHWFYYYIDKTKFQTKDCETSQVWRDTSLRLRWLPIAVVGLVASAGTAGYVYRDQIWPKDNTVYVPPVPPPPDDPAVIDTGDTNHHGTGNKPSPKPDVISRDETKSQKTNPAQPVKLYKVQPITFGYSVKATFTFSIGSGLPFSKVLMNGFLNPRIQPLVFIRR